MSVDIQGIRAAVGDWLTEEFTGVQSFQDRSFDFVVPFPAHHLFVVVTDIDPHALIRISAPLIYNAPLSDGMRHYVLERSGSWVFGSFLYFEDAEGSNVSFVYSILGDHAVKAEVVNAVNAVAAAAMRYTDELHHHFGGQRAGGPQ